MQRFRTGVVAMVCAAGMVCSMTYVSAQRGGAAGARGGGAPQGERIRHLVYIATPGDNGTDNQSGVVVLDADKNYSFLKRISYGLPAAQMPGPKNAGIAVSVPLQMLFVTTDGWMKAIDLSTDQIAWTFNGESTPVQKSGVLGALSGCCERPWLLPDGKTLVVGSSYNAWWYYIDGPPARCSANSRCPKRPCRIT
jgi:hypothetical protein